MDDIFPAKCTSLTYINTLVPLKAVTLLSI